NTYSPGYYSGGISANNGTITLNPGTYVLGPPGLQLKGNANIVGTGVTIFLTTGSSPNSYNSLLLQGSGNVSLYTPTSGACAGITIFQDRNTPYNAGSDSIGGTGTLNITGTIYVPSVDLAVKGGSANIANEVIANTAHFSGGNTMTVNFVAPSIQ